jgi:hypothetical protein
MFRIKDEVIAAAAHQDIMLLIKQYARTGYEQTTGSSEGFEGLWRGDFAADDEVKPRSLVGLPSTLLKPRASALDSTHTYPE